MDAFHIILHVSQLRKRLTDHDIIVHKIPLELGHNLTLDRRPVRIIHRIEKATQKKVIQMIKVVLDCNRKEKVTWET